MAERDADPLAEAEAGNYLASVSDLMSGLLFVFIITLAVFVIEFQLASVSTEAEREVLEDKVEDLTNARTLRRELLADIEQQLDERGVRVEVDLEHGILRLTEETVRFRAGSASLDELPRTNLRIIGQVLAALLPCYTVAPPAALRCDLDAAGKLEAVFIEGHTDSMPVRGKGYSNWELSSQRAINAYQFLASEVPVLAGLGNQRGEALISVAGYAATRPLVYYDEPTSDERNRRIDIRFIMAPPEETPEIIQAIRDQGVN